MQAEMQAEAVSWAIGAALGGGSQSESEAIPQQQGTKTAEESLMNLRRMAGGA